jgi:peptide subunit release factor 1 (eRF1)
VRIEIGFPSASDVVLTAKPVIEEARRKAIDELVTSLEERDRDRVAIGAEDVLQSLFERRVWVLVVDGDLAMLGRTCPTCGWIGLEQFTCPSDSTQTVARDDVVDAAIDLALQQDARVVQVPDDVERRPPAPIAALLRY